MADKPRLEAALSALNDALGDITPYKLAVVAPQDVRLLDQEHNARYMTKKVYDRLLDNIKRDTNLSSLPFLWRDADGSFVCLSGNHRIMAARDAGVELILALYTDADMSQQERVAVQLSHNSLVGQDDPARLRSLWDEIKAIDLRVYSGLDDGLLQSFEPVKIARVDEDKIRIEELRLLFVLPEIAEIKRVMKRLGDSERTTLLGHYADFERFFDVLLRFKESQNILNTATAFMRIIAIAEQWLDNFEREHNADEHEPQE